MSTLIQLFYEPLAFVFAIGFIVGIVGLIWVGIYNLFNRNK